MKIFGFTLLALLLAALALLAWIRLAPSDAARWHIDPATVTRQDQGSWLLRGTDGNAAAPRFDADPDAVMRALDRIALATSRTRRIAGDPETGIVTYVTRSRLIGFPDYTTVRALQVGSGTELMFYARLRFGQSDLGVNRVRVEDWVARLRQTQF